jgi:DNA repair protein RecN (Recombination protein N)
MLAELRVRDLGVIADLTLVLGPGMTAVTGETGAGKTLVVEAIELLVGSRADSVLVRPGAPEAWVEGRFVDGGPGGGTEVVLARAVPSGGGRSRAYVDGHLAPVSSLAERGARLVDLHGQHAHQSLLSTSVQRHALDAFAAIDLAPLSHARADLQEVEDALAAVGGDSRAMAREVDLLRFQIREIERAALTDPGEDEALAAEENRLADAGAHREAAAVAYDAINGEGGAVDAVAGAVAALAGRAPVAPLESRLRGLAAELADAASDVRAAVEALEDDPARLADVQARRQQLRELRRKYGETLADVLAFAAAARARLAELESHDARVAELEGERSRAWRAVGVAAASVGAARRAAAPRLAAAVEAHLADLGMSRARVEVRVGMADPGDDVTFLLAANPGDPALPLAKVASGGELARAMLAARLVLTAAPATLVFDEVDAGIGGQAAVAVGRALAALSARHQVLVVTHLPQVAAFADQQVAVVKELHDGRAVARAVHLDEAGRLVELSRMLSGQPASSTARDHAEELLATATRERARTAPGPPRGPA